MFLVNINEVSVETKGNMEFTWSHRIEAQDHYRPRSGIRSRAAWWLRQLADKLDGGRSVRINCQTTPVLTAAEVSTCLKGGLEHANRLLGDLAHHAACELALRDNCAHLFPEQQVQSSNLQ